MKQLITTTEDHIHRITINREDKMNALNLELISELDEVFDKVYKDENIRAVILTGKGSKAFAAGADIAEFSGFSEKEGQKMSKKGQDVFAKIEQCPKPVIAAVNGFALGGGCELAMACHVRIATENSKFGQPEVALGIIPGYGGTQRLVQLIGKGKALEAMMTAEMINAEMALNLGLVTHVVSQDQLMHKCEEMLRNILDKGPLAVAKVIRSVNACFEEGNDGFATEQELFGECFGTEDFKEGTSAFIDKRKAEFKGK